STAMHPTGRHSLRRSAMPADPQNSGPIRLLLVCRSARDTILIKGMLAENPALRFDCRRVEDIAALEAMCSVRAPRIDAVLAWTEEPSADEEMALRRIVTGSPDIPLIMSTEFPTPELIGRWASMGIDNFVTRDSLRADTLVNAILFGIARSRRAALIGYDDLTGLPTRALWQDRLGHGLQRCRRNGALAAMMIVDIDDFKQINDTLGHEVGDAYLTEIAHRIRSTVRSRDTVARIGGDEFAVLLEDLTYPEAALRVARKIIKAAGEPIVLARASLKAAVSVGIALLSSDQPNLDEEWAHQACDMALQDAKKQGKNRLSVFTADMDRALLDSLQLDSDLLRAVENDAFVLYYQPMVEAGNGQLEGFEALLRWERSPGEILGPDHFLPALERLGLMDRVGASLFAQALIQLGDWRMRTRLPLTMHVNLSATQLIDQDFSDMLLDLIRRAGVPPAALTIELTETVAFRYGVLIEREFARLRRHGVRFAIDDFGTGYNSMTYLKQFRPDAVKIDRSFITTMIGSVVDTAIVRAQAVMAASLGIDAVAEGVETMAQLTALQGMAGVSVIQGYLIGRPMAAAELEAHYAPLRDRLPREPLRVLS
ncbi:MAG: Diguanylate cyclase protein, partial [Rhizorhabdus sp.]|nr:Diguanylate cyclase protein [Rhizorhabdus sp.]